MLFTSYVVALGFNAVLLLLSLGLGRMLLSRIRLRCATGLENTLLSIGLGYALIAYALLAIGLAGALTRWAALAVLGIAAIVTIPQFPASIRSLRQVARSRRRITLSPLVLALIALIAVHAVLNLIGALAPPSMADPLRHHLAAPKYYTQVGGFPFVPIIYWNAPGTLHVIYTLELLLANDLAPAVTRTLFAFLTALAVYALGRRYLNTTAGLLGATVFYTLPMTTELATAPMVEFGSTFFAVLLVSALLNAGEELELRWVALAGLFGGLAGATKLWALLTGPAGVVAILVLGGTQTIRNPRRVLSAVVLYCIAYGVVLSPWLLRNYLASGDPLWPVGYPLFHGCYWTDQQWLKFANWRTGPGDSLWHFLTGPWALTNNIVAFTSSRGVLCSSLLSPLLLAFVPAVWLFGAGGRPNSRRLISALAAFCLTVYVIWFQGYQNVRYIQIVHPLISLLASAGVATVLQPQRRLLSILTSGALVASFTVTLAVTLVFNIGFIPVVFGYQSRQDFLAAKVSNYNSIAWANQHLPSDANVLFMGLSGWYYLDRNWWLGNSMYQGLIPFHDIHTPQELLSILRQMGFTHVLRQANSAGIATVAEDSTLGALEAAGHLELIHVGRDRVVNSRTFGGIRDVQFAVYALRWP